METAVVLTGELLPADTPHHLPAPREAHNPWLHLVAAFLAGYAPATRAGYGRDIADWTGWCNENDIDPFTARRAHVDLWARHLDEELGRGRSTVARKLSAISGVYKYALTENLLDASPTTHIRRPKVDDESQTTGLTRDEVGRLRTEATKDGARSAALIDLLVYNGLRISETLSIRIEDLREERGHTVATIIRKGGKKRVVPFAPTTKTSIAAYIGDRATGPIFEDLDRHNAYTLVLRLARRAGLRVTPHGLRHTWVTLAREAGVPLEDVQDAAGHADPRTTRRYDRARHSLDRHPTYALAAFIGAES